MMADPAREEVDRYLNSRPDRLSSHPEDRHHSDSESEPDEKDTTEPAFQSSLHDDTDDEELASNMASMTTTRPSYQIPTTISYANTGPKGVIADAQHFARAKKSTFRQTLTNITNNLTSHTTSTRKEKSSRRKKSSQSDRSTSGTDDEFNSALDEDNDDAFMTQWREARLRELQLQSQSQQQQPPSQFSTQAQAHAQTQSQAQLQSQRRISPSRRTYGTVTPVDAEAYLDAVEHTPSSTNVVVLLYDPTRQNLKSRNAERQCDLLAYRHRHIRFVKLDYSIAEMEYLECPSIIGYRAGDVVGTCSGSTSASSTTGWDATNDDPEGLEGELIAQGILPALL